MSGRTGIPFGLSLDPISLRPAWMVIVMLTFLAWSCSTPSSCFGSLPLSAGSGRPAGAPPLQVAAFPKINEDLQRRSGVRVIARLTHPEQGSQFVIEKELKDEAKVESQRKMIAERQRTVLSRISDRHAAEAKRFSFIPFMALEVDAEEFRTLLASPEIDLIEEDPALPPILMNSVPLIGGADGSFGGFTGAGQTVAILDTGVDKNHPFLSGKVVAEGCFSTTYAPQKAKAVCTDGSTLPGSGLNCDLAVTGCYHGTHVAGIAAGKGSTFNGVAKDATVVAVQVFSRFDASECGTGATAPCAKSYVSDQIAGLQYIYDLRAAYNIAAVNMSLGSGVYTANCDTNSTFTAEKAAIDSLRAVGIATVIAAGNSSSTNGIAGPACISSSVSVGATDKSDIIASYSNMSPLVDLLAPGSSIYSSMPGGAYQYLSGTSMAAPHVAGAWAAVKSARQAATVTDILNALASTGVPVADTRSGGSVTRPRIRPAAAVAAIMPPATYPLTLSFGGVGSGTVHSSPGADINCTSPGPCSAEMDSAAAVSLTPQPVTGSLFSGWAGDCSGTGACSVIMDRARNVQTEFALMTFPIAAAVVGTGGSITPANTTAQYGSTITFTITPDPGFRLETLTDNANPVAPAPTGGGAYTYTLAGVAADHVIQASFIAEAAAVPAIGPWGMLAATGSLALLMNRERVKR